ncbi:putative reverse transcriptase domain-containing protein [Tanacetum coccineum]
MEKLENEFWNHTMVGANHVAYTDRFHELANLVPHLVTPESSRIKRYISGLAPQIRGMLRATQPTTIQSAILSAGILTNEAVRCGTLTKGSDKRKEMEESSKQGSTWKDNKKSKTGSGFVVTVPPRNDNVSTYPKCAKCYTFHPENAPCKLCYNFQKQGHYARQCWAPIRQVAPVNAVRMGQNQRACYECGSLYHLPNDCPKWKQATRQARKPLALEGNRNTRNNGNQASGRAFNRNAVEALQDPKVLEPCIVNPGYVIEIADGESVEVDRIIRDCKLELGNSLFTIDLIPLSHGSLMWIMGMDVVQESGCYSVHEENLVWATHRNNKFEFRVDLVPGATPVAKSPYRLAPSEMQELSRQLQELQDKDLVIHREEAPVLSMFQLSQNGTLPENAEQTRRKDNRTESKAHTKAVRIEDASDKAMEAIDGVLDLTLE